MQVDVRVNGVEVWQSSNDGAFNLTIPVAPGNTIDFAVYGGYMFGNTPLDATITIPEPATVALLGFGVLSLVIKRK